MKKNLYSELSDRTKQIFKSVVESYLETGSPSGSETVLKRAGLDISSASVRAVLSNLQKEGLLFSPHTSAGRVPTEKGMRFFVDGLLEFGRISKSEKENIEQLGSSKSKSYQQVLDEASRAISGLSNYAGIVIAPKYQKNLKHLEFIRLNSKQIMSILAYENGEIENRIIDDSGKFTNSQLLQVSNYLDDKFRNKNIAEIKRLVETEITKSKSKIINLELPTDDPKQRKPDLSKAKTILNYNPIHKLEDGLAITVKWFKENYPLRMTSTVLEDFPICMNDDYKINNDPVLSYRQYYIKDKSRFAKWKYTTEPSWYTKGLLNGGIC